uniref:Putative dehydrin 10 n=1 Tax=Davidia involucrata TaxID=16924 RepID=A0A5B7AIC8_DAVIN
MAGIIHKIETTLGMGGGQKEGDKRKDEHKPEQHSGCKPEQHGEHKPEQQKGGFMENIKDKIHGQQRQRLDLSTCTSLPLIGIYIHACTDYIYIVIYIQGL